MSEAGPHSRPKFAVPDLETLRKDASNARPVNFFRPKGLPDISQLSAVPSASTLSSAAGAQREPPQPLQPSEASISAGGPSPYFASPAPSARSTFVRASSLPLPTSPAPPPKAPFSLLSSSAPSLPPGPSAAAPLPPAAAGAGAAAALAAAASPPAARAFGGVPAAAAAAAAAGTASSPPPPAVERGQTNIIVNQCQKGNPVLKYIRNAGWTYGHTAADYAMSVEICALYLSLRYHLLNPEYIYKRLNAVKHPAKLCVLLCLVDVDDNAKVLQELARLALVTDWTLILAWSNAEAARWLETYKLYESKGADIIKERPKEDYVGQLTDVLTGVRGVNRTDVDNLMSSFGSLKSIMGCSIEELSMCPGLGERKIKRLYNAFNTPFVSTSVKRQAKLTVTPLRTDSSPTTAAGEDSQAAPSSSSQPSQPTPPISFSVTRRKVVQD